jgi:hypothetical protein
MPDKKLKLIRDVNDILRESVTATIAALFNVRVDSSQVIGAASSSDDFVCCGELAGENSRATIVFVFERELILAFVESAFAGDGDVDPALYEATALEIVNIVGNRLKTYLNLHGYNLTMALPSAYERSRLAPDLDRVVHLTFSLKDKAAMDVDFYLRCA